MLSNTTYSTITTGKDKFHLRHFPWFVLFVQTNFKLFSFSIFDMKVILETRRASKIISLRF